MCSPLLRATQFNSFMDSGGKSSLTRNLSFSFMASTLCLLRWRGSVQAAMDVKVLYIDDRNEA